MHNQLAGELPPDVGRRRLVISATKEIEPGARAMLLLAEGLFRLDVSVAGDTLRTIVRNLSSGQLEISPGPIDAAPSIGFGEVAAYEPGQAKVEFTIGAGRDSVEVQATIATLRFADRGTLRVSAQAIVRQPPPS
jgi:hypothetical protein